MHRHQEMLRSFTSDFLMLLVLSFAFLSYQLFTQSLKLPIWILAPLKVASVLWCMWEQVKQWLHQRHVINYRRYEGLWANIGADENWSGKCKFLHHLIALSGWLGPNSERNKGNWVGIFTFCGWLHSFVRKIYVISICNTSLCIYAAISCVDDDEKQRQHKNIS